MIIGLCISFFIVIIDQLVKYWTVNQIELHQSLPGIEPIFDFFYIQNTGAGWGILAGEMTLFYIITIAIVSYLLWLLFKTTPQQRVSQIAYGLLIGGAVGNFIDRLLHGYVVDMFRLLFIDFPIFNVADMALTVGIIILVIVILFDLESKEKEYVANH